MPHKRSKRSVREQLRSQKGADLAPPRQHTSESNLSAETIPKSLSRVLNAAKIRSDWKERKRQREESGDDDHDHGGGRSRALKNKRSKTDSERGTGPVARNASRGKTRLAKGKPETNPGINLSIQRGETLAHFNKRVEAHMAPLVKSAMQTSAAVSRKAYAQERRAITVTKRDRGAKGKLADVDSDPNPSDQHSTSSPSHPSTQHPSELPASDSKYTNRPKEFESISSSAPRRLNDITLAPPELTKLRRGSVSNGEKVKASVVSIAQKAMMEAEREKAILRYRQLKEKRTNHGDITPTS